MHIFLDNELKNEEEHDFLKRIDTKNNKNDIEKFYDKQNEFGTIESYCFPEPWYRKVQILPAWEF